MAIALVSIVPLGTGTTSVSRYVAACHRILMQQEKLTYQLTPMGTILEGDLEDIFDVVRKMHEVPFGEGALRVSTTLKVDDRRDKSATMDQKVESVKAHLGGKL